MNSEPRIQRLNEPLADLSAMRKYPENLYYLGNQELLLTPKISIVGTRKPSPYTRQVTHEIARKLSGNGICIVSGAAMGVDAIAHQAAGYENTIAVMGNGLNNRYPSVNKALIQKIESEGLCLSPFDHDFRATKWSFVVRNEIIVALGEALIVTEADLNSGSLRSVEYAKAMGKPIYVIPHRMHESLGTNALLAHNEAEVIYDIDAFVERWASVPTHHVSDPILDYCRTYPTYESAVAKFGEQLFAYELEGKIEVVAGYVRML